MKGIALVAWSALMLALGVGATFVAPQLLRSNIFESPDQRLLKAAGATPLACSNSGMTNSFLSDLRPRGAYRRVLCGHSSATSLEIDARLGAEDYTRDGYELSVSFRYLPREIGTIVVLLADGLNSFYVELWR